MTKQEARKHYKTKRNALSKQTVDEFSLAIANKSLEEPLLWKHKTYHLFLPIEALNEVNTTYLLHILQGKDKNVVVSKSDFKSLSMQHFLLTEQTKLQQNSWGIPEPVNGVKVSEEDINLVFVPLLIADKKGNRVGYGKGFYDRFLAKCNPHTLKVGLCFFSPLQTTLEEVTENDIPLDYLVTPEAVFSF